MTTYATGNPIGSTDPRDLYDNAQNMDIALHTGELFWLDRFGTARTSWAGATGYVFLGDYAAGLVFNAYNQVFRYNGEFWRPAASTALPYTLTGTIGTDLPKFVSVGDATLRQDLAASNDPARGSTLVGFKGRTVYDRLSDTLNAKDKGVTLGGVANDTSAWQAAINEASSTGKLLISGPGTSMVAGLTIPSNLRWLAVGTKLKLIASTDASILINSNVAGGNENIVIEGLELDGNSSAQGAISRPAVLFKNTDNVLFRKVTVHDAKITTYTTDTYDQMLFVDCNYVELDHCVSYSQVVGGGIGFYGTGGNHRLLFNHVYDCVAGIEGAYQTDSHLFGNIVENSDVGLISWNGLRNIMYKNRCFDSSGGAGIVCGHSGTPDQVANGSYVVDNIISDVFSYGVTVFASSDVTVSGNQITRVAGDATHSIYINTGCSQVYVRNNSIRDYVTTAAAAAGIFVDGCSDVEITGNKIYGAKGGTTGDGIRLFNACPNAFIAENIIVDTVAIGVNISQTTSTNSSVLNNKLRNTGGIGIRSLSAGTQINGNSLITTGGAQGILIGADRSTAVGNLLSGMALGGAVGIFVNAVDVGSIGFNTLDNMPVGISLPSGSDLQAVGFNSFSATVTTKMNVGTNTGTKVAHNIGVATHDV